MRYSRGQLPRVPFRARGAGKVGGLTVDVPKGRALAGNQTLTRRLNLNESMRSMVSRDLRMHWCCSVHF